MVHFTWKVLSLKVIHLQIVCQSEHSLRYFHLGRISDLFSIHRSSSHMLPAAQKRFRVASRKKLLLDKFKIRMLKKYRFSSKIKLHPPIETVWSLNFRASIPTLYVKNKMAEASLLPPNKGKKILSRP